QRHRIDRLAGLREPRSRPALSLEQRMSGLALQRPHMRADRWLGNVEPHRSAVEAALLDHGLEHRQAARTGGDHGQNYSQMATTVKPNSGLLSLPRKRSFR